MTDEKAREVLGDVRVYLASRSSLENEMFAGHTFTDICNAIQVLEQGDVLDKIRAEINSYGSIWVEYKITGHTDRDIENIVENVLKQAKKQVLDIIDKYKTESEE